MKTILFQCRPRGYGVEALIAAKGQNCVWINEILGDGPQRIDCKPSMVCSRRASPPCALSKHQGSDSNPKAAAVSSVLFIMMKLRLLCGGMTFSRRGFQSNSTFYDMFHMIIRQLNPPAPLLVSRTRCSPKSIWHHHCLLFPSSSFEHIASTKSRIWSQNFVCSSSLFFFILAARTLSAFGTFAKLGGKTTCVARVKANDSSIDK